MAGVAAVIGVSCALASSHGDADYDEEQPLGRRLAVGLLPIPAPSYQVGDSSPIPGSTADTDGYREMLRRTSRPWRYSQD